MLKLSEFVVISLVLLTVNGLHLRHEKMQLRHQKAKPNNARKYKTYEDNEVYEKLPEITVNLDFHVDYELLSKFTIVYGNHSRAILKEHVIDVVQEVRRNFKHPSLRTKIDIGYMGVNFLKKNPAFEMRHSSKLLKKYCNWQAIVKKRYGQVWVSVLLSGFDLYYIDERGNKILSHRAKSYNGGACNANKSCVVSEGQYRNLAHTITHEIGHSLGIRHDGEGNVCAPSGFFMARKVQSWRPARSWSSCSAEYLDKFLQSNRARCLKSEEFYNYKQITKK